jgi:hypothetical protein
MATKKPPVTKTKAKPKPARATAPPGPTRLQNLAARPPGTDDDMSDDGLVDHSGVFRVQTSLARAQQRGREEDTTMRFASDSLVMAAQSGGLRDDGPTLDEAVDDHVPEDEATAALRRERLATLAARAQARPPRSPRR